MLNRARFLIVAVAVCIFIIAAVVYFDMQNSLKYKNPTSKINNITVSSLTLHDKIKQLDKILQTTDIEIVAQSVDQVIVPGRPCIDIAWAYLACKVHKSNTRDYSNWKEDFLENCSDSNTRGFVMSMID